MHWGCLIGRGVWGGQFDWQGHGGSWQAWNEVTSGAAAKGICGKALGPRGRQWALSHRCPWPGGLGTRCLLGAKGALAERP